MCLSDRFFHAEDMYRFWEGILMLLFYYDDADEETMI